MTRTLALAMALCALVTLAHADVLELKTGQKVEGTIKNLSISEVAIEVGDQTITFEIGKIRALYFGAAPSSAPAMAAPSGAQEALRALRELRSATTSGVTMRDYISRTADTKVKVDRYLQEPEQGDQVAREAVGAAMKYYSAAGGAWSGRLGLIGRSPSQSAVMNAAAHTAQFSDCNRPDLQNKIVRWVVSGEGTGLQEMWGCASDKVAEAERLMSDRRGFAAPPTPSPTTTPHLPIARPQTQTECTAPSSYAAGWLWDDVDQQCKLTEAAPASCMGQGVRWTGIRCIRR